MSPLRHNIRRTLLSYERPLGPAKLYLDDLEEIAHTLEAYIKQHHGGMSESDGPIPTISINAGDAEAETVEDLRDATSRDLLAVRIALSEPAILLNLASYGAKASAQFTHEHMTARVLVDDLRAFVNSQRAFIIRTTASRSIFLSLAFLLCLPVALIATGNHIGQVITSLLYLTIVFVVLQASYRTTGAVEVVPKRRSEARGVSEQTRRDLVVALIGAFAGAFFGIIGTLFMTGK